MIQPKYNKQINTIFLDFDSIEINLVCLVNVQVVKWLHLLQKKIGPLFTLQNICKPLD